MLDVKNIEFSYNEERVLEDVSFQAVENEVISIMGPNGVGKTTLLKCLCNFHRPQNGKITIDGKDVSSISSRELAKHIGYVPQRANTTRSTVFDSVLIGRRPYIEISATKRDLEVAWNALDSLGLGSLALRYVDEISGGELQKVPIARAMVQEPRILVLDEPTNNLDIANQHVTLHNIIDAVRSGDVHDNDHARHQLGRALFGPAHVHEEAHLRLRGPDIIDERLIKEVYGIDADVIMHKGVPFVIPHTAKNGHPRYTHNHVHAVDHDPSDHVHEALGIAQAKD